jgi:FKBP-type peptidyl-prolyl cis-trans isomerase SlpA
MSWELTPENGFGIHRPELVQRMALSDFPAKVDVRPGAVIEFSSSDGLDRAGRVLGIADGMVTLDFNHPLSGKSIRFEADVIAIL